MCLLASSSARFSAATSSSVGPAGTFSVATSTFCFARELRQQQGAAARDDHQDRGDHPAAPAIARALFAQHLRAQLVDLRQHAGIDFFELAHRARCGRLVFVRHDGGREVVGRGAEDRRLGSRDRFRRRVFEAQRVLQHRVHLVGHVAHGRRTLAALLGQQPRNQQLEARRNRLDRLESRHRLGGDLLRVEGRIERRITRQQLVRQRAEAVDVIGGPRRLARELLRARRKWRTRRALRCCRLRRRRRRNPRAAAGRRHRAGCSKA